MKLILSIIARQAKKYPGQYALLSILVLLTAALWIAEPLYSSYAINKMLAAQQGETVSYTMLFLVWGILFIAVSVIQTAQKFIGWKLTETIILDYREAVYAHVLKLGISFHTKQKSGEVVKILDTASDTLADLQRELLIQLLPSFLSAAVFLVIGYIIHPLLASILVVSIAFYLLIAIFGTSRTVLLQQKVNTLWVQSIGRGYDAVTNIFSVKSGAQEEKELERMRAVHKETFETQQKVNRRWAVVEAVNFFMLTRMLLVAIGIYLYVQGDVTLGLVYFFQTSFFRVLTPFEMLGGILPQWNKQVGRVKLAEQLLQTPVDIVNSPSSISLGAVKGQISFNNVSFAYAAEKALDEEGQDYIGIIKGTEPPADMQNEAEIHLKSVNNEEIETQHSQDTSLSTPPEVLRGITLHINPGERIALVGHSGAGKSTVAMLINRFYDPTEGEITVDGMNVKDIDVQSWRAHIGLVLQDNLMFNDTIFENIRYARPNASMEDVMDAATRAAASEFIEKMPMQYQTLIGDRGIRLSGGQRQRIAIARAILKNPSIVVLDEATSALDSVTERHVQEGIQGLIEGKTAIIIAHRLSTVRSCDRIAVMEEGRVTAFAPHEDLMGISPVYREMVELQREGMLAE